MIHDILAIYLYREEVSVMKDLLMVLGEEFIKIQWKSVIYHGKIIPRYRIGSNGAVKDLFRNSYVKTFEMNNGYICINLVHGDRNKKHKTCICGVHRLVAEAFIPNPENKPQVNHIDGNKKNNAVANLEWVTAKENKIHAIETGLDNPHHGNHVCGENSGVSIYNDKVVRKICRMLEKGYGNTQISRELNVHTDLIRYIRKGGWKHISSKYDIPKPRKIIRHSKETREKISALLDEGMPYVEIARIVGLPDPEHYGRKYVCDFKSKHWKK